MDERVKSHFVYQSQPIFCIFDSFLCGGFGQNKTITLKLTN